MQSEGTNLRTDNSLETCRHRPVIKLALGRDVRSERDLAQLQSVQKQDDGSREGAARTGVENGNIISNRCMMSLEVFEWKEARCKPQSRANGSSGLPFDVPTDHLDYLSTCQRISWTTFRRANGSAGLPFDHTGPRLVS